MAEFVKVLRVSEINPGELRLVEAGGEQICLANVDGKIYAINDACTHVGGYLDEGELEGQVVTCPLHGSEFDVTTGKVLRGPAREDIATYEVKIEGDDIYVAV
jgi:3-phenylpropionate/trans-cinnamate dioxygenase ferredoxin subunit